MHQTLTSLSWSDVFASHC